MESRIRTFNADETICVEGAGGDEMHVVLKGRVGITAAGRGEICQVGVGEFFNELAVIDAQPCLTTATALEDETRVHPIDQAHFVYLVSHQPAFSLAVMAALGRQMRNGHDIAGKTASGGVAHNDLGDYSAAEVRPGLWQLHSRTRSCNVYLIAGDHRTILVDTGLPSAFPSLAKALRLIGHPIETINFVVLTHEHADHVGGAAMFPGGAIVAAHPLAANKLALRDDFATVSSVIGEAVPQFHVDLCLPDGTVIDASPFRFEILHTPGHTSGCLCLVDPAQSLLICGDTVMGGGAMGGIFGSGNISDYVLSLRRLQRLRVTTLLSGHGRLSENAEGDIGLAAARAETLLTDTRELLGTMNGQATFDQIMRSVRDLNR